MSEFAKYVLTNKGRTLITPDHEKADIFYRVLKKALGKSDWVARGGMSSKFYFDFDKVYADPGFNKEENKAFHDELADQMKSVIDEIGANCVGLIFPKQGPVGVVQLRGVLAERLLVPTVIIRINEKLLRNQVWFERTELSQPPLGRDSRVLLFCDAVTSGASIYRAASIVRKFEAECLKAFVLFNRLQGANERLQVKHIELFSLIERNFFEKKGGLKKEDFELDKRISRLEFESVSATL